MNGTKWAAVAGLLAGLAVGGGSARAGDEWQPGKTLPGHGMEVRALLFTPDGSTLVSGSLDGTLKRWDPATGKEGPALAGHRDERFGRGVNSLALSPDGKTLASGGAGGFIKLWDLQTGRLQGTLRGYGSLVHCLAFAPDGKTLASLGWARVRGSFDVVKVWDVSTRRALASFETRLGRDLPDSSRGTSPGGAFAPDARTLARSYADRTVKLWDLKTRKVRQSFPVTDRQAPFFGMAFSPDGKQLATAHGHQPGVVVKVWDVGGPKLVRTVKVSDEPGLPSLAVALAPDGQTLAVGDEAGRVRVWDLDTGRLRADLKAPADDSGRVTCLAFSPDGKTLAAAGAGAGAGGLRGGKTSPARVRLWGLRPPEGRGGK